MADVTATKMCACVMSRDNIHIALTIAALNALKVMAVFKNLVKIKIKRQ